MAKLIEIGLKAKLKIKKGIDQAANAVRPTLGAVGKSAIIEYGGFDPIISDDGITVLKNIEFKDKYENVGAQLIRKIAQRANDEAGDGTSTATVLGQAFIEQALKEIGNDSSKSREVQERLQAGLKEVLGKLSLIKENIKDKDIERIATLSCLDSEMGRLIADIFRQIGHKGIITVEDNHGIGYASEVVKGMRFNKGFVSPYFINSQEKAQSVLENPHIILIDRKVSINDHIKSILESILTTGNTNILLIADAIEGEAFASLVINHQRKAFNIACVQAPFTGQRNKEFLNDIALLTGATVISEEAGMKLENCGFNLCGKAQKVIVSKDNTTIVGGAGDQEQINLRAQKLEAEIKEATGEYDKQILKERLAGLTGGIGVIKVGAFSDTERKAKKYKTEDAVNATKAALEEGVVAGGGTALAFIAKTMKDKMFQEALTVPFRQMAVNAGMFDKRTWKEKLLRRQPKTDGLLERVQRVRNYGFNFKTKDFCNLLESGVLDPVKVTRLALESAISIASTLITVDTVIVNESEEKQVG
jgi:chaperonin GroEL